MPEALQTALATEGLAHVMGAIFLCGLVYGFAGFGSALVFQPLAAMVVPPVVGIAILSLASIGAGAVVLPRAVRVANLRQVAWILIPAILALPPGVWLLVRTDVTSLRWIISALVAATLMAMVAGWRQQVAARPAGLAAVGAATGGIGGATGLHGPVVILFTLSGQDSPAEMRASLLIVLTSLGVAMLPVMRAFGHLPAEVIWLGVLATPAYMAGVAAGQAAFHPRHARLWRLFGYVTVAGAVVAGLPVWT